MKPTALSLVAAALLAGPVAAGATIVSSGDGTFTDTTTGFRWMDLSTFYGDGIAQDLSLLLPGFSIASRSVVDQLEADTGITASTSDADFQAIAAAMGAPQPNTAYGAGQEIIWGQLDGGTFYAATRGPPSGTPGWYDFVWTGSAQGGLGAFAVDMTPVPTPGTVPEPATLALLGLGLAGIGFLRKRNSN